MVGGITGGKDADSWRMLKALYAAKWRLQCEGSGWFFFEHNVTGDKYPHDPGFRSPVLEEAVSDGYIDLVAKATAE